MHYRTILKFGYHYLLDLFSFFFHLGRFTYLMPTLFFFFVVDP